ncbi:hypothetical protein Bca52824_064240 [Brassica carinata]|uniref:PUM-HD domain-containing protein n=1 Tax=Brassica carinata TaxID=52824 RepID=A0A8X7U7Y7_BRACI|nr:hypothetical protein Bca52824_064240 [Brassica carinata]
MTINQNGGDGDANPEEALPPSPSQQLLRERLKTYENMYGSLDDHYSRRTVSSQFAPLSDLRILESDFRRLGVSDSNHRQQPLRDQHGSNQFPLNGGDRGINEYFNPLYFQSQTEKEQINPERLWFRKDNPVNGYSAYKSSSYGSYGRDNSGTSVRSPYFYQSEVPFSPSNNHNSSGDQSPWSYSHGYVPRTHDPFNMNNSRATDNTLSRAKNRVASVELQNVILEGSRDTVDKIFDELISHVCELMTDSFGHQVFQKLMEKCTNEQITRILDIVTQQPIQFVRICGDLHGTRAVQDLIRCLSSEEQISHFMVTICHVALLLSKSTNANDGLLQMIVQNCYQVAIDHYGSCLLQQCIGKSRQEIREPLIREIITNATNLCVDRYGNYVVQYVLELENFHVAAALSRYLSGNYVQLSCDKYGSHAVQKCLESRQFNSRMIINELLTDIDSLLVNPFGNYVIQTAWVVSQNDMRSELLYHIRRNHSLMRCNRYGRKILEKLNLWT